MIIGHSLFQIMTVLGCSHLRSRVLATCLIQNKLDDVCMENWIRNQQSGDFKQQKLNGNGAAPHPLALGFRTFRSGQTWQLGAGTYEGREKRVIGKVGISVQFPSAFSNF